MSADDNKTNVVIHFWNQAQASLNSAILEYNAKAYNFAVNRSYYAMFYAVTALLLERDRSFVKHSGVRAAFHQELVKPGLVDSKWSKVYDRLFDDRQHGDYVAMVTFEAPYVETYINQCREFLESIKPLIAALRTDGQ